MLNNKPLRVAMLSLHSSPLGPLGTQNTGGMSVYVREVSRFLGARGHRIDIYTYVRGSREVQELYPNVRLIHLLGAEEQAIEKGQMAGRLNEIFETLERFRCANHLSYDLIHSHYWLSGVVGAMAQAHWRCPHLTMFHTLGIVKNSTASSESEPDLRIAHERWLAKVADYIVVPSAREMENLLQHYRAPVHRAGLIPCGVNLERFKPMDRSLARKRLGIAPRDEVVLFVGRFAPLKGLDRLIEAVARVRTMRPGIRLLVIGGDGSRSRTTRSYHKLAAGLGVRDRISFVGRVEQPDLPPYYSAADLLALPSHYESFGLVVLESLACGTPVVATPVGTVETVIQNGLNGEIIQAPRTKRIAAAIEKILSHPPATRPPARTIRETVGGCSWENVAGEIDKAYAELVQSHDPEQVHAPYERCSVFPS
ncbi:MAG: glycosyltransferase [Desulfosarcinaceae bacterium]